jgi:hypothetical protein
MRGLIERYLAELVMPGCIPFLADTPATTDGSAAASDAAAGCIECAAHGAPPLPAGWCEQYHGAGATSRLPGRRQIRQLGALA